MSKKKYEFFSYYIRTYDIVGPMNIRYFEAKYTMKNCVIHFFDASKSVFTRAFQKVSTAPNRKVVLLKVFYSPVRSF